MVLSAPTTETAEGVSGPRHVAIIMDGNGRWAERRLISRSMGHKRGAEAVKAAIEGAVETGVDFLTLYAFSSENWNRPVEEVKDLMGLLKNYLNKEVETLHKQGIRLRVIGDRTKLASDIRSRIEWAEKMTENNSRLTLIIALSYGSRDEMVEAVRTIAESVAAGRERLADITESRINNALYTHDIPDPDLIIRTSGEQRLSNFLLWQAAYSEFLFLDVLWPDFSRQHFIDAVDIYLDRDRRFGARP
ncbi:isoprenyl transferase [Kordiimonas pumila]|uniref:Isoprenyl transferase n=1 Tax=Kordiimonas pumila TaxID=2161677 RepID=A0ABV7D259_9PROT|nr:isoprenyl transferase [Kordiimonas pumila]